MKIIIHHHALVFQDESGYWFPSFIGSWLNEISNHFDEVAFIGEMTNVKKDNQDFLINKINFLVLSIGIREVNSSRQKNRRIIELGNHYSSMYSHLIIRGITPRQYQVFKAFKSLSTSFLMVGSLKDSRPQFKFSYLSILVWVLYYLRRYQLKLISKRAKILANSPQIIDEFKTLMKINAEFVPTNTLQNFHFEKFSFRAFQKNPILLFCGRVVKEKGIEELIYAMGLLNKIDKTFKLIIVGSISASYKCYLDRIIEKLGISEHVKFKGFIKFGGELLSFYRAADIYVLPSYHEGFPHSIWEASSACVPIITTKVGGIPGLVSENEVFFTDVRSIESLKKSIEFVIANPEIANKKAFAAYNLGKNFTIENCVLILKQKLQNQINNLNLIKRLS